jgi:hypothetical protein
MPFVPAPNIVQAEVRALLDSQKIENRWMIDVLTAVTPTLVDDVANLVNVWAQDTYFDFMPDVLTLVETVATDMSDENGSQVTISPSGAFTGALSEEPMPNETTFCISLRSSFRGRSARGRTYMLATTRFATTGNLCHSGRADQFKGAIQVLIDRVAAAGWALSIVSYRSGGVARPGGPVYFPVTTALYTDLVLDSMRRRKPGNGS